MVNYPHKVFSRNSLNFPKKKSVDFANRGMSFEKMINDTNDYYLSHELAVIHKKPTPIQIVKVDYPRRSRAKIVEAYFPQASRQKASMPMKNFHAHQIEHMEQVVKQGGICFVLLHFSTLNQTYLLPAPYLINFFKIDKGKKSMPLDYIQRHGYSISQNGLPSIPYLEIIQQNLLGGKTNE